MKKFKVTFIGAGSIGFTRDLVRDLLSVPEFRQIDISFTDINPRNLEMVGELCQRDIDHNGLDISIHTPLTGGKRCKAASISLTWYASVDLMPLSWISLSR